MDRFLPIKIFGRVILLLRDIPTVESFDIEKVVHGLFFIIILSIGMFFPRKIHTHIVINFSSVDFIYRYRNNLEA